MKKNMQKLIKIISKQSFVYVETNKLLVRVVDMGEVETLTTYH